jgi:hypothetical protein
MTTIVTLEKGQAAVLITYDYCSGECVGIHASWARTGGRLWSQSGRVSKTILKQPGKISPKVSACGMITALNIWRMTFKNNQMALDDILTCLCTHVRM